MIAWLRNAVGLQFESRSLERHEDIREVELVLQIEEGFLMARAKAFSNRAGTWNMTNAVRINFTEKYELCPVQRRVQFVGWRMGGGIAEHTACQFAMARAMVGARH